MFKTAQTTVADESIYSSGFRIFLMLKEALTTVAVKVSEGSLPVVAGVKNQLLLENICGSV